jgi:hypothetical protein
MPQELARQIARSPADIPRLERMFTDLLLNYKDQLHRKKAPPNDVARAASFLVSASYRVYFDTEPLNEAQYRALRAQMHQVFVEDDEFQKLPDREKQKLFEGYGIVGSWISLDYDMAKEKGDTQAMGQWREMAQINFENMLGVPPEKVRFTAKGIEYR